jgi:ATP-dependent helicase/nuclease subunit A
VPTKLKQLDPLLGQQADASHPGARVWLSASAGTGKTHVLTARVLRLLLTGVDPASILCLTFTKAGAAEMADRIHARLAHWVRLSDTALKRELFALGEAHDPPAVARARALFARVLDAPGGGLRIQTIHAFCQALLAAFPVEAGLVPGFRPLDGPAEAALARTTLADLLVTAEQGGDRQLLEDVQALTLRMGEGGAETFLLACGRAAPALEALGADLEGRLRRAFSLPEGNFEDAVAAACADDAFPCAELRRIAAANAGWATQTGLGHADLAARFLAAGPAERGALVDELAGIALTSAGDPRKPKPKLIELEAEYEALCARLGDACRALADLASRAAAVTLLTGALRAGRRFAAAYVAAKRAAGVVDFDDLVTTADRLLNEPGIGEWVRYKVDRAIDHILVDEAQDTNARQWSIVAALAADFFTGAGVRPDILRTIFTVGDFKQAIFGFQGTNPLAFEAARRAFSARAEAAAHQARGTEWEAVARPIETMSLDRSFRSTPPVLALVDRVLDQLGAEGLGLADRPPPHLSSKAGQPGTVLLWRPVTAGGDETAPEGEEAWVDDATRLLAGRIARQVRQWLERPLQLEASGRPLRAEDVLILVRRRGTLASLLVARLHAEGVPVAGVDRLRLAAPLAVQDLVAAIRFAVQPDDDLNLASLIVSPLVGLDQEALFGLAYGRRGSLWSTLRQRDDQAGAAAVCRSLLASADLVTPYRFLEELLSGPLDGRRRLMERLGPEARDPIEELLSAALAFENQSTPSLQLFLDWFDHGDVEITRDPSAPLDAVRVMTVHGAKGLQAPLVILADATGDPDAARGTVLSIDLGEADPVPVPRPRKAEAVGPLADALAGTALLDRQEHWRLFYVAATRAEEMLVVAGALSPKCRGVPPASSWYTAVDAALDSLGAGWIDDPHWGGARVFAAGGRPRATGGERQPRTVPPVPMPDWLTRRARGEERPPRPLAPSSLGRDDVSSPPPDAVRRLAAERGRLLHQLFERLPAIAPPDRPAAADRWLREAAGLTDAAERRRLVADSCRVLADPSFAGIFGPDALAEAPIAAVVDGEVIAGTVDRLLVGPERVLVVDYKTGRSVPATAEAVPAYHLRQMSAYAAALAVIFPGRQVEAALLYTAGPVLLRLPEVLLGRHKPGLQPSEQSLVPAR